jgi:hypothetical protein
MGNGINQIDINCPKCGQPITLEITEVFLKIVKEVKK